MKVKHRHKDCQGRFQVVILNLVDVTETPVVSDLKCLIIRIHLIFNGKDSLQIVAGTLGQRIAVVPPPSGRRAPYSFVFAFLNSLNAQTRSLSVRMTNLTRQQPQLLY